ncbi:hypothetical protein BC829DRAFT_490047 [Chytridium lagenaria]|nr:hypothetical protein BC829DRAFT_490047 [Chytridium lagenaria]
MRQESLLLPYELAAEDDHPLFDELCFTCRAGDLDRVKYLVEVEEVPLNRRDKWDSTPLYYSALCGQIETARYLLSVGAKCDPTTFEGERCFYGALNNEMRNLLKSYQLKKTLDITADFSIFLTNLFQEPQDRFSDVVFKLPNYFIPGTTQFPMIHAHKCIVAARCPYLARQFASKWLNVKTIPVKHYRVHMITLQAILMWMYTGQVTDNLTNDQLKDLDFICRQWRLTQLQSQIEPLIEPETDDVLPFAQKKSAGVVTLDPKSVKSDLSVLVQVLTGPHGQAWCEEALKMKTAEVVEDEEWELLRASHPDVVVKVEERLFPCHRAFLTRSEYFKGLLMGSFVEAQTEEEGVGLLNIAVVDDEEVFRCVLEFLYTHDTTRIRKSIALKVMEAADFLLLPRLKTLAVIYLMNFTKSLKDDLYFSEVPPKLIVGDDGEYIPSDTTQPPEIDDEEEEENDEEFDDTNDILPHPHLLLRASWSMNLPRLEQHLTKFYAERLCGRISRSMVFKELIRDSSESVKNREEVDTVIFVDDLRWWIGKIHGFDAGPHDDVGGREDVERRREMYVWKMGMMDAVLAELGIDA